MIRKICFVLILVVSFAATSLAQELKIGYANIELVLLYMPETKSMNQTLQTFQKKLGEKLQTKQEYAQTKFQEYQEKAATMDDATRQTKESELMKLDEELKTETADAEKRILEKRQSLMDPILKKLDTNLKELAAAEGYDYILNSVDGNGVSIVLHGPEEYDLTEKLLTKLGIEIPKAED